MAVPPPTSYFLSLSCPTTADSQLFVFAKYINSDDELGYSLNSGSYVAIGQISTTGCTYTTTITGLTSGDTIQFSTLNTSSIGGSVSDCPLSAGGCTYTHNFDGNAYVYITIDGSDSC